MDGSGYPLHLEKEHLTLADRIISIADIFTALTEDRPYRKGMAWQEALQIMEADVINGALDSDVFLVLRHHAETLHAIILQTLAPLHSERRLCSGPPSWRGRSSIIKTSSSACKEIHCENRHHH